MPNFGRLFLTAALALSAPASALGQEPFPVLVVNATALSGTGSIAGNNFNNGVLLALKEINAGGGILGHKIEAISLDTQSKPEIAKAAVQKAAEMDAYAIFGPVLSDLALASMEEIQRAEIPTFVGAEATSVTGQGNPYVFRTSLSQAAAMPKLARYLKDGLRVQTVAMVSVDNAFGQGGREAMIKALDGMGIKLVADISAAPGQKDYAGPVQKITETKADAAFVYLNEAEAADCLRELHKQAYSGWIVGETTILGQSVIDLAGEEAANGIRGHVGLTPDALQPTIREFNNKFLQEYNYKSDHNGMKGYIAA
jgi:branched-chain amino acid transport system substrate-binding protein